MPATGRIHLSGLPREFEFTGLKRRARTALFLRRTAGSVRVVDVTSVAAAAAASVPSVRRNCDNTSSRRRRRAARDYGGLFAFGGVT